MIATESNRNVIDLKEGMQVLINDEFLWLTVESIVETENRIIRCLYIIVRMMM